MLSILKLLTVISILSISVTTNLVAKTVEERIKSFEKRRITSNPAIKLHSLKLSFKKELKDGWYGYLFDISFTAQGKKIEVNDIVFSNGKMITSELKNLKNSLSFKKFMYPKLDAKYYKKSHLIAGNINARHKLVVFSDPLCPNCTSTLPKLIEDAKRNPKKLALYYVSFPLPMHPTATTLANAAKIASKNGIKNVYNTLYTAKFETYFHPYQNKNHQKTLDAFNKVFKTKITMKQINDSSLNKKAEYDIMLAKKAFVQGTPTLFTDGEIDLTRQTYKKYIK
ncbi:hypothetical protein MNB_ARC-1_372 [hydrothermal vent metagenome]|uniref:Thioredoxin-like fold domain-containing protein n=1 Tax=hydrothermal vent metagenome TaxID=652676 RepID=A0A3B1E6B0_9ZZZZ